VEEERKWEAFSLAKNEAKWRDRDHNKGSNLITIVEADGNIRYASPAIQETRPSITLNQSAKNTFDWYSIPEDLTAVKITLKRRQQRTHFLYQLSFAFAQRCLCAKH
jgi:hypothetical protein